MKGTERPSSKLSYDRLDKHANVNKKLTQLFDGIE